MAYRDGKLISGEGYEHAVGRTPKLPTVEIAAEDYRRIARMAKMGENPVLEVDSDVRFIDDDHQGYNIIADIPGADPKNGYVMAGAHFDSWVASDGAADNGAGSVVVMEAARILRQLGVKPKRTIRFSVRRGAGFGSLNYVDQHIAATARSERKRPENYRLWRGLSMRRAGYGGSKPFQPGQWFRQDPRIYAEGNGDAVPSFVSWRHLTAWVRTGCGGPHDRH
jgi:hypothetical protein